MTSTPIDRRTALYGAAVVAAGATLAACGSSSTTSAAPAGSTDSSPMAASTSEASVIGDVAPKPTATASGAAAVDAGIGSAAGVTVGGGAVFTAAKVVVTQPTAGNYKGFSAVCTHQGCLVASVAAGVINCPCHGSSFSIKDGSVISGPATAPLPPQKITVAGGTIKLG